MYLVYLFFLLYVGWRISAPIRSLIDDKADTHRSPITTILCFIPMAWSLGYTATVTLAWILAQSANLLGLCKPEVAVCSWVALGMIFGASLFVRQTRTEPRAFRFGHVPPSCGVLVIAIWSFAISVTFGLTTIDAGVISTPQNLARDLHSHTAIIRSFSVGYNFPTEYPFFDGSPIRYHFLFYFGGGVLEALGAPLSVALNLPSGLALGSLLSLAAFICWRLTNSLLAAWLAIAFCLFRSSLSWIDWIAALRRSAVEGNPVFQQSFWYGITPYEDWGIFSLNVHLNQRHLMHGLTLMLVVLVACLLTPPLRAPWQRRAALTYCVLGAIIGCGVYWNGNAFIATMLALIPLACVPAYRVKAISVGGSAALSGAVVVGLVTHGAVVETPFQPSFNFGFLSPSSAPQEVIKYALWIFGALPVVSLIAAWRSGVGGLTLWWCGLMPIAFIFVAQVTPIAPQGHKFINAGTLIWSILSAGLAASLLRSSRTAWRVCGQLLILVMTITGIVDAGALVRLGRTRLGYFVDDSAIRWIQLNTPRDAIFLSASRGDSIAVLAGRRLFIGPKSLTSETGNPYDERVAWLREVASLEPSQQVLALRDKGVMYIATEVCTEMRGLIGDACPAHPEAEVLVKNPLLPKLYVSPDVTILGVPRH